MSRQIRTNSKYELVQTTVSLPRPVVHLLCDQSLCPLFLLCDCHSHFAFIMNFPDHCVHANIVPQQKISKGASRQNNLSFCMTMLNLPKRFQLLCLIAPLVLTAHDRHLPQFDFSFITLTQPLHPFHSCRGLLTQNNQHNEVVLEKPV